MAASKNLIQKRIRQLHKTLAPIMLLPLVLTAITGSIFQVFDLIGQERSVRWLMALHKGHFGILNLTTIYPFLNALGLLILVSTGFSMWLQKRSSRLLSDR
ncbi:MAG TPA: PepSY domain-containing protein [Allocoleopsis sp.]